MTISGVDSDVAEMVFGVPQGSVLGPVLFLIYMMDLGVDLDGIQNRILKYVDDSKIINYWKNEDDIITNQEVMDKLYPWAENNNMAWHDLKFQVLRIGNSDLIEETEIFTPGYAELITRKQYIKGLGILVDRKVTYNDQKQKAVSKTNQKAG